VRPAADHRLQPRHSGATCSPPAAAS